MLKKDAQNKCILYDKYFLDDLYPYKYNNKTDTIDYYKDGAFLDSYNVYMDELIKFIVSSIEATDKKWNNVELKDVWVPCFVSVKDSKIETKMLFKGSSSIPDSIGLEKAFWFDPKFQNWDSGSSYMSVNWILTPEMMPFIPKYGLMFWYKKSSSVIQKQSMADINTYDIVKPIKEYHDGINSINPTTKLIKKTDDLLLIIEDKIAYDQNNIKPVHNKHFSISRYLKFNNINIDDVKFSIYKSSSNNNIFSDGTLSIWIPDGDTYSYIESEELASEQYKNDIISKSYLSPVLHPVYREIYHLLTLGLPDGPDIFKYKKRIDKVKIVTENGETVERIPKPLLPLKESRIIKKIAHILSTMPYMDRTTVGLLEKILYNDRSTILELQNLLTFSVYDAEGGKRLPRKIASPEAEQQAIFMFVLEISQRLTSMISIDKHNNGSSGQNGLVTSKKDLFYRLLFKYGSKLVLFGDSAYITYKNKLKYGPHVKINHDAISRCTLEANNKLVYNNVKFQVGKFQVESKIGDKNTELVLSNQTIPGQQVTIPLWDIQKKNLTDQRISFTAGKDVEIDFLDPKIKNRTVNILDENNQVIGIKYREIEYELSDANVTLGDNFNVEVIIEDQPEIEWTRISGPDCLRFSNRKLSPTDTTSRYPTSYDYSPTLYIKRPGKYVLQMMAKTSFSLKYDIVTIHVTENNVYKRTEPLLVAETKFLSPQDNLIIMIPSIRECVFGKQGVFWPCYSDCSVKIPQAKEIAENINNLPQPGGSKIPIVVSLGQSYHKFAIPMPVDDKGNKVVEETDADLSIRYKCQDTIVEISRLILSYIMDNNDDCSQCESIYRSIPDNNGFILDAGYSFSFYDIPTDTIKDVSAPVSLSTKAARIKAYGGFSKNEIANLKLDIPFHPEPEKLLDKLELTEELLNTPTIDSENAALGKAIAHICHDTHHSYDASIEFSKGYFHPFSGWLSTYENPDFHNKTSVTNFKQNTNIQSFKGLGIYDLKNNFLDSKPVIYKSTITLQTDPEFLKVRKLPKGITFGVDDQIAHYGYRAASTDTSIKMLQYNDTYISDFAIESDSPVSSEEYCNDGLSLIEYNATYSMGQGGIGGSAYNIEIKLNHLNYTNPKELIVWIEIDACDKIASSLSPPSGPKEEGGVTINLSDPWYFNTETYTEQYKKIIQIKNTDVQNFMYRLWDMNDNDFVDNYIPDLTKQPGSNEDRNTILQKRKNKYYLYLLNQDHIHNFHINNNILFTDYCDKYYVAHNHNIINTSSLFIPYGIHRFRNNNVSPSVNGQILLSPTLSASNFSDTEIYRYKNIILNNNLYNSSHRFSKFKSMPLYDPTPGPESISNSSSTSFTLCIAVVGETESLEPFDRLRTTDASLGFIGSKIKNKSNLIDNSLCSWELLLHKADGLETYGKNSLNNIDYYNDKPVMSGYNFIANLENKTHLLPPINLNAPNMYTVDGRLCSYSKESLNIPSFAPPQTLNISPIIPLMPFTLIGALVSLSLVDSQLNQQAKDIANYLGSFRRGEQKELFNRSWFVPKYDRYPFGYSDKSLISVSKDQGQTWYKLEASIFKYNNSLTVKNNEYKFFKLHYKSLLRSLSIFKSLIPSDTDNFIRSCFQNHIRKISIDIGKEFENIPTKQHLIDDAKKIKQEIKQIEDQLKENPSEELSKELSDKNKQLTNILNTLNNIGYELEDGDIIELSEQSDENLNGMYVLSLDTTKRNTDNSFVKSLTKIYYIKDLCLSKNILQYNDLFSLTSSLNTNDNINLDVDLETLINTKKIAIINDIRAYHFFNNSEHKNIVSFSKKDQNDIDQEKLEELQSNLAQATDIYEITRIQNEIWDLTYNKYTNRIIGQGYVAINNDHKTILIFDKELLGTDISIEPEVSKRILITRNNFTGFHKDDSIPFDLWSNADHTKYNLSTPVDKTVSWGVGNYGYGSNLVRPYKISSQEINNQLRDISDIINTNKNSYFVSQSFKYKSSDDNSLIEGSTKSLGFQYSIENIISSQYNINNIINMIPNGNGDISENYRTQILEAFDRLYNSVVTRHNEHGNLIEVDTDISNGLDGTLIFKKDISTNLIYKIDTPSTIDDLKNRIKTIDKEIESEKDLKKLAILYKEKEEIIFYRDRVSSVSDYPHISVRVIVDPETKQMRFEENHHNDYYWINIDPDQSCSIDKDKTTKILKSVTFVCIPFNDKVTDLADQICVPNAAYGGTNEIDGIDEKVQARMWNTTYTLSDKNINEAKAKYPKLKWPDNDAIGEFVQREFFLNFAGIEKAQLVKATYEYILPVIDINVERPFTTTVQNKVYNIFNLDDINRLKVDFKRIPRMIKNKDTQYDIYEPNDRGQLSKSIIPSPGGPIDSTFKVWKCLDIESGAYVEPPLYYKWLNEMLFRAHFGSVDAIEHKGVMNSESKDETYWIPYDYN
jgi:hypothetical protein